MHLKLIHTNDYETISQLTGEIILSLIRSKEKVTLGLATGSTPIGTYQYLVEDRKKNGTSYQNVTTFNLDEYVGLDGNHPQSYRYFMDHHLFHHLDIPTEKIFIPNGMADDLEEECKSYEKAIREQGGIDLQLLGIGHNGHIGFNEPGTPFSSRTHVVKLTENTRQANSRFFSSIDEVPSYAITVGVQTIFESKQIVLIASGESKAPIMEKLLTAKPTEELPASILKNHPNAIIIADKEALKNVNFKQLDESIVVEYK